MSTNGFKRKADGPAPDAKKPKANASITSFFGAPKGSVSTKSSFSGENVPVSAGTVTTKFDKEAWIKKLTPEQKELLQLEIDTLHESWLAHLKDEIVSREFLELKRFLKQEYDQGKKIFPPPGEIYAWSYHTPLPTVKAVIVGQDPYHNVGQAHGLCFSVRPPTRPPPSLVNIYKALGKDYPDFHPPPEPNTGLLTPWAERGILLLNTCLTVRAHEANSHSKRGWERFTQKVIDTVARVRTRGVVFLAWGNPAATRVTKIDKKRHCVLYSVHPSPLSASRGFFDCGHFKKTNEWLHERYGDNGLINWNLDPTAPPTTTLTNKKPEVKKIEPAAKPAPAKPSNGYSKKVEDPEDEFGDDEALEALAAAEAIEAEAEARGPAENSPMAPAASVSEQQQKLNGVAETDTVKTDAVEPEEDMPTLDSMNGDANLEKAEDIDAANTDDAAVAPGEMKPKEESEEK